MNSESITVEHFAIFEKTLFCCNFQNNENFNETYRDEKELRFQATNQLYMFHQNSQYSRSYRNSDKWNVFMFEKKLVFLDAGFMPEIEQGQYMEQEMAL